MTYGQKLKAEREGIGMTQSGLAEAADMSVQSIRCYEQELRMPTFVQAVRLAGALGVSVEVFAQVVRPGQQPSKKSSKKG